MRGSFGPLALKWGNMKKVLMILGGVFFVVTAVALTTPPSSKEGAYLRHQNKIINPGAENGTSNVTVSAGTLTATTLTGEFGVGKRSFKWCPAASGNTLSFSGYAVETGLKGQNGEASMLAQTSGTNFALRVFDGSNVLGSTSTLTPQSTFQTWTDNFIFPSSGTVTVNAIAGNPTNCIFLDDAYLGRPSNIGTVEQAQFVGSAYFAATTNCEWTRTNTALGAFGTDADCPAPTIDKQVIGSWQTTDADLPRITINNLLPGLYKVTVTGTAYGAGDWTMAVNDGTNTRGYASGSGNGANSFNPANTSTSWFEYTSAGNRSFEIYGSSSSGAVTLSNAANNDRITFVVERYPLQSQMVVAASQADFGWTATTLTVGATTTAPGKGTTVNDSMLFRRNKENLEMIVTYYQNGAGTAGSGAYLFKLPNGLQADTTKLKVPSTLPSATAIGIGGSVVGSGKIGTTSAGDANYAFTGDVILYDADEIYMTTVAGSALSRQFPFSSSAATNFGSNPLYLTFFASIPILGWQENQRAPALINSVVSRYEGSTSFESADVTCSSSSTINNNPGSWISSIGNISSGQCAITIANGVFSGAPDCVMTPQSSTAITDAVIYRTNFISSTSGTVAAYNVTAAANATTFRVDVLCKGPK